MLPVVSLAPGDGVPGPPPAGNPVEVRAGRTETIARFRWSCINTHEKMVDNFMESGQREICLANFTGYGPWTTPIPSAAAP